MKVLIAEEALQELLEAQGKLAALEDNGVEDWEWFDEAIADYSQENVEFILRQYKWDTTNETKQHQG